MCVMRKRRAHDLLRTGQKSDATHVTQFEHFRYHNNQVPSSHTYITLHALQYLSFWFCNSTSTPLFRLAFVGPRIDVLHWAALTPCGATTKLCIGSSDDPSSSSCKGGANMNPLEISIPTTATTNASKPYTVYNVCLSQPLRKQNVQKRFSDFVTLNTAITSQSSSVPPPCPLPQKAWLKSTVSSPALAESRRKELEQYLQAINNAKDPRWRSSSAWRIFLNLPGGLSGGDGAEECNALHATSRIASIRNPVTEPSVWLDIHRDLKSQLRDARQALAQRAQAGDVQAQRAAAANAQSHLLRAATTISSLDHGLHQMNKQVPRGSRIKNHGEEEHNLAGIGEGEFRRRKDLLATARKERQTMDDTLRLSFGARSGSDDLLESGTETELNSGRSAKVQSVPNSLPGTKRRILGTAQKETERTRELDNDGVLQLQKQLILEQDQEVTDLTNFVRRMKEMGVQINDELEMQSEMLNMLDQDADRVSNKVNVAKKRIGKIS